MSHSASRGTNPVACGCTRLTAPPRASNAIAAPPPRGPLTPPARSMALIAAWIPLGDSRLLKKSDLANDGTRGSTPPGLMLHCGTLSPRQPASYSIASRNVFATTEMNDGCPPITVTSDRHTRLAPVTRPGHAPPTRICGTPRQPKLRV